MCIIVFTLIPPNRSQVVPLEPAIVNPTKRALALLLISTMNGFPRMLVFNTAGTLIKVDFAPDPVSIKFLPIVICSVYVPGSTFTVFPELAAFIAACMVP